MEMCPFQMTAQMLRLSGDGKWRRISVFLDDTGWAVAVGNLSQASLRSESDSAEAAALWGWTPFCGLRLGEEEP